MDPSSSEANTHVAIVGAGPIGIELGVALKRAGIEAEIFDAGPIGQTIAWWAPQTRWFSSNERIAIAGVPLLTVDQSKATREEYLMYLRSVVTQFQLNVHPYCPVVDVQPATHGFCVTTKPGGNVKAWSARAVVLAIGGTDHPRKLGIPGEDLPHVDGYLRETHRYFGRRVLIIGGRNSAIEAALRLHHAGAKVSLSYRGEALPEDGIKYWLRPEINGLLKAGRIENLIGTEATQITSHSVSLRRKSDGKIVEVPADDVLSLIGYSQEKTLLQSAGIHLLDSVQRPEHDPATMQTNVPGIYVAGTAVAGSQTSKYKTFLENCHDHVDKIVSHLSGKSIETSREYESQILAQPES
ncbi:NAD(P)-binding domain-containing protein [Stieleria sp. JC731]|uniref:NAD(P)-binding domain-containing protein n=1 Tax=Pirellulaceae TaxID=2691357 RepID=UPI001E4FD1F0|nr:NAD(P)-binding domain-containing protein [Stieleria sp. JC731]MCC9600199.1 NAD(P)-binding domain-containing protein [Stieleria sp. JC731]